MNWHDLTQFYKRCCQICSTPVHFISRYTKWVLNVTKVS